MRRRLPGRLLLVLLLVALVLGGARCLTVATPAPAAPAAAVHGATATSTLQARATATVLRQPTRTPVSSGLAIATPLPGDRLVTVRVDRLPAQAQDTIRLIDRGGPFPYRQDGVVFENREGLLPRKGAGYYHEYTVQTPGSSDRGARRLVRGAQNELYYTDDHYGSFKRVTP
jgi:ribonuclease T1